MLATFYKDDEVIQQQTVPHNPLAIQVFKDMLEFDPFNPNKKNEISFTVDFANGEQRYYTYLYDQWVEITLWRVEIVKKFVLDPH